MKILGIGGTQHDYSYCVVEDGVIRVAIEEERVSREKHSTGYRSRKHAGLNYCLNASGDDPLRYKDFDLIVANDAIDENHFIDSHVINHMLKINHHTSHAGSAYYLSDFSEAAVLILDGGGSNFSGNFNESCTMGYAQGNKIDLTEKIVGKLKMMDSPRVFFTEEPHTDLFLSNEASIPLLYLAMTEICGFKALQEGKLMGLAPYGKDTYVKEIQKYVFLDCKKAGSFKLNIDFEGIFNTVIDISKTDKRDGFTVTKDLAYATQVIFEDVVTNMINYLYEKAPSKNLCYAGGAALNSVLNGKIKKVSKFENVFVFPAAGDAGTSIGSALYGYHHIMNAEKNNGRLHHVNWGKVYDDEEIQKSIEKHKDKIVAQTMDYEKLYDFVAMELSKGSIAGWFQDGAEFGPRALGNRSILADPRVAENKDKLNDKVKFREAFRPFAPVIVREECEEYFDTDFKDNPFMLFVGDVKENKRGVIPAGTHVDGTARLQTIDVDNNKKLHNLLLAFKKITGVPVLINTSFNIKGDPIVETPAQAIDALLKSDMDLIVIQHYVIQKKPNGGIS